MPNSFFYTAGHKPKALLEKTPLKLMALLAAFFLLSLIQISAAGAERPFPKPKGLVNDFANVIPTAYKQKIAAVTGALLQKTGIPVVVVTMPDIGGAEYNDYANRLYKAWGIGKKGEDKGVLIFVTVKERKMRIETGYGVEGILPDGLVGEIRDRYMVPYLKQDKFGEGLLAGATAVARVIAKASGIELSGQMPKKTVKKRGGFSFFPIIILIIVMLISKKLGGVLVLFSCTPPWTWWTQRLWITILQRWARRKFWWVRWRFRRVWGWHERRWGVLEEAFRRSNYGKKSKRSKNHITGYHRRL